MKRQHYTNEEKEKMLFRYASEQTDVQDLLQEAGIPKSTFNQWLREYDAQHNCQSENDYSPRNFRHLKLRNQHLEDIVNILDQFLLIFRQSADCLTEPTPFVSPKPMTLTRERTRRSTCLRSERTVPSIPMMMAISYPYS